MALTIGVKLVISIIFFILILSILGYLLIYSRETGVSDYKASLASSFILVLIAVIMMIFTLINLSDTNVKSKSAIFVNTCPDYYYKDKVKNAEEKFEIVCKPFIFEGSDNEFLYVIKELQPIAKSYETIENDNNNYNNNIDNNPFYEIIDINDSSISPPPNKYVKVLNYNDINKKINIHELNKVADKVSDYDVYNKALCACGLNLPWNEVQHTCGKMNFNRDDDNKACMVLSTELHSLKDVNNQLQNISGFDFRNYYDNLDKADTAKVNNKHFVDLKSIQVNLTS